MLTRQNGPEFGRKKTELRLNEGEVAKMAGEAAKQVVGQTAGATVRDEIIKRATEAAYEAGNRTDKIAAFVDKVADKVDKGTAIVGGTESSGALAKIAYKTTKDVARGDSVCTGLCIVSAVCETVAMGCSTIKKVPCRGRIYLGCKMISKACMTWRNACAGEGC